jgi:hypothetical protein
MLAHVSILSVFKSSEGKAVAAVFTQRHAVIDIFAVALGLLYEVSPNVIDEARCSTILQIFTSIMNLSVLRNTKHTAKF